MDGDPVRAFEAKKLIKTILPDGEVKILDHCKKELAKDDLILNDALNVLNGGVVDEAEFENGKWRHHVRTSKITVVVEFETDSKLVLVTAWRNNRRKS